MSLKGLQEQIGVNPDGVFGPTTLKAAAGHFKLTPVRAAHFFGQAGHESVNFTVFEENLNYGVAGLLKTFGKYFPSKLGAMAYAKRPEKIANRVYANRMGNGDEASGDGWKYRGRGAIQVTGKDNYRRYAEAAGTLRLLEHPELLTAELAFDSALWFFNSNKLWSTCDLGVSDNVIKIVTKRINGGYNGLDDRIARTRRYAAWLKE